MIIPTSALPSKGYGTLVKSIEIKPLTYKEMIEYSDGMPKDRYLRKIWDIEKLIKRIPEWRHLNCYDIDSLIFTTKYISAATTDKFTITFDDGSVHDILLSNIKFENLNPDSLLIKFIKLNEVKFPFNICTVSNYLDIITELSINSNIKIASLAAILGYNKGNTQVLDYINGATYDEILLLDNLYYKIFEIVKPIEVDGAVVDVNNSITDIFRFLKINKFMDKTKVILDEGLS